MKKGSKKIILGILALTSIFLISYMATDIYVKSKNKGEDTNQASTNSNSSNKYLNENVKVVLQKNGSREAEKTLDEVIDEYGLEGSITQDELTDVLSKYGYTFDVSTSDTVYYNKDLKSELEPNKYYIGEYEGYLAIYKSNDKGELEIEDEKADIYRNGAKFTDLKPLDQEAIKKYQYVYDTKEDAKLDLTGIS